MIDCILEQMKFICLKNERRKGRKGEREGGKERERKKKKGVKTRKMYKP